MKGLFLYFKYLSQQNVEYSQINWYICVLKLTFCLRDWDFCWPVLGRICKESRTEVYLEQPHCVSNTTMDFLFFLTGVTYLEDRFRTQGRAEEDKIVYLYCTDAEWCGIPESWLKYEDIVKISRNFRIGGFVVADNESDFFFTKWRLQSGNFKMATSKWWLQNGGIFCRQMVQFFWDFFEINFFYYKKI